MFAWLAVKKTIISAVATAVFGSLTTAGVIGQSTGHMITYALGAAAAIFLRLAVK